MDTNKTRPEKIADQAISALESGDAAQAAAFVVSSTEREERGEVFERVVDATVGSSTQTLDRDVLRDLVILTANEDARRRKLGTAGLARIRHIVEERRSSF